MPASTPRRSQQLARLVEQLAEPRPRSPRSDDQLGGHERAPGERPALPAARRGSRAAPPAAARTAPSPGRGPRGRGRPGCSSGGTWSMPPIVPLTIDGMAPRRITKYIVRLADAEPDDRRRTHATDGSVCRPADDRADAPGARTRTRATQQPDRGGDDDREQEAERRRGSRLVGTASCTRPCDHWSLQRRRPTSSGAGRSSGSLTRRSPAARCRAGSADGRATGGQARRAPGAAAARRAARPGRARARRGPASSWRAVALGSMARAVMTRPRRRAVVACLRISSPQVRGDARPTAPTPPATRCAGAAAMSTAYSLTTRPGRDDSSTTRCAEPHGLAHVVGHEDHGRLRPPARSARARRAARRG